MKPCINWLAVVLLAAITPVSFNAWAAITPAVCAGFTYSAALRNDGTVFTWGANVEGQLGNGDTGNRPTPEAVAGIADVVDLAAGPEHSLAAKADGTVWAWGSNWGGQLGNGTNQGYSTPKQIAGLDDIVAVWAGHGISAAVRRDGKLFMWGSNWAGQLGDGTSRDRYQYTPQLHPDMVGVKKIWGGFLGVVVMKDDGTVWEWGYLTNGGQSAQVSPKRVAGLTDVKAVAVAHGLNMRLALASDGTVWAWGGENWNSTVPGTSIPLSSAPARIDGITDVVALVAGFSHVLLLGGDGSVSAFGNNNVGQLGDGTASVRNGIAQVTGLRKVSAIYAGYQSSYAQDADGRLWGWGGNGYGELGDSSFETKLSPELLNTSTPFSKVVASQAGQVHAMLLTSSGGLLSWGANGSGQLGASPLLTTHAYPLKLGLQSIQSIACGRDHVLAIASDGSVWGWGANSSRQLGDNTVSNHPTPVRIGTYNNAKQVLAGDWDSYVLLADGSVWSINIGNQLRGLSSVVEIAGGMSSVIARLSDGTVAAYGRNDYGQYGSGSAISFVSTAAKVPGLSGIAAIAARADHAFAVGQDGSVWAWGRNDNGQLGDGTTTDRYSPVRIGGLADVVSMTAGADNSLAPFDNGGYAMALKRDGTILGWGYNRDSRLGDGTYNHPQKVPVSVTGLNRVISISAGYWGHSLALRSDGTVWAWGGNNVTGQLGNGTFFPNWDLSHGISGGTPSAELVVSDVLDGPLDLIPEEPNAIPAGKVPVFWAGATKSGDIGATSLNVDVSSIVATTRAERGRDAYNLYVAALVDGGSAIYQLDTERRWTALSMPMSAFMTGVALDSQDTKVRADILHRADLTKVVGAVFLLGYGTDSDEMLRAGRYRGVFTVVQP